MWIDPGQESQGIAAMSGDTFAVTSEVTSCMHQPQNSLHALSPPPASAAAEKELCEKS